MSKYQSLKESLNGDDSLFSNVRNGDVRALLADLERAEKALAALAQQAQVKPFAYMADDVAAGVIGGQEVLLSAAIRGAPGGTFNFPLYTRAQQAKEPVWANDYATKVHAQIEHLLNDLITTQVSCNLPYFGVKAGMLTNNWVSALKRLHAEYPSPPAPQPAPVDELPDLNPEDVVVDVVLKQLGGFAPVTTHGVRVTHKPSCTSVVVDSERSQHRNRQLALEALRAITHHQARPEPVDELIEALEDLMDWQVKNVKSWHNRAYDRAHRAIKKHRAALQSPAPQTKGQS